MVKKLAKFSNILVVIYINLFTYQQYYIDMDALKVYIVNRVYLPLFLMRMVNALELGVLAIIAEAKFTSGV